MLRQRVTFANGYEQQFFQSRCPLIRVPGSVNRAVVCFCNTLSRHIRHKTVVSMGVCMGVYRQRTATCAYRILDSYTAFLEQRASNNFPDILRNFVRMRQQWFPGRFSYGLGTRLARALLVLASSPGMRWYIHIQ